MFRFRGPRTAVAALALLLTVGVAWAAAAQLGVIGPSNHIQPTGRQLHPVGKLTKLGNFPTGGALTTDGRFLLDPVHGPRPQRHPDRPRRRRGTATRNAGVGDVVQTIPMPGSRGGIAMAPDGHTAYVSGVADSAAQGPADAAQTCPGREAT